MIASKCSRPRILRRINGPRRPWLRCSSSFGESRGVTGTPRDTPKEGRRASPDATEWLADTSTNLRTGALRKTMGWSNSPLSWNEFERCLSDRPTTRGRDGRRAMPPDNSDGIMSAAPRSPTACSFVSTTCRISLFGSLVCSLSGNATFSKTLRSVSNAPFWNSMPKRRRNWYRSFWFNAETSIPSTRMLPRSGRSWRVIRLRSVVLPVPLGPMMAVIFPRLIVISSCLNICRRPRV